MVLEMWDKAERYLVNPHTFERIPGWVMLYTVSQLISGTQFV